MIVMIHQKKDFVHSVQSYYTMYIPLKLVSGFMGSISNAQIYILQNFLLDLKVHLHSI